MSGGRLVVLDRAGRDVKQYPVAEGLATLGTDPACDIRVMLPTVSPHHATIVVHANQTVVQSVSEDETLVNGVAVNVAVLRHNDLISLGGRHLRWEYSERPAAAQPGLSRGAGGRGRGRRARASMPASVPAGRNTLVHSQRASMPASTSMKQVAIVQPQRRETASNNGNDTPQNWSPVSSNEQTDTHTAPEPTRKSSRPSPRSPQASTTKASQWIESRKSTRASLTPARARGAHTHTLTPTRTRATLSQATPAQTRDSLTLKPTKAESSARAALSPTHARVSLASQSRTSLAPQSRTSLAPQSRTSLAPQSRSSLAPQSRTSLAPRSRTSLTPGSRMSLAPRSRTSLAPRSRTFLTPQVRSALTQRAVALRERACLTPGPGRPPLTPVRADRRDASLRQAVLRRTHTRPVKIEAPTSIDHTKQAAIMLMTRHTKSKSPNNSSSKVSYVVKKPSPVRKTPRVTPKGSKIGVTPKRTTYSQGAKKRTSGKRNSSISVLEINGSDASVQRRSSSRRSKVSNTTKSPSLPSPKKSALKNPKNNKRKTESIKFDLSNLENDTTQSDIVTIDTTNVSQDSISDVSLHYSDSSINSPSSRRPIHSRSSRIMEKTLGRTMNRSIELSEEMTPQSPRSRFSPRSSSIVQKALEQSNISRLSRRLTKSVSEQSLSTTVANQTKTLTPRASNVESYSIVDLVSVDSNGVSEYNSLSSTPTFGTPRNSRNSKPIDPALPSSTPYNKAPLSDSKFCVQSASMITPENDENFRPFNSTRISRASRSRSRINDSDLLLLEDDESPRTSKRTSKTAASPFVPKSLSVNISSKQDGTVTPENVPNNEECTTPVLSIQSLLDSSQESIMSPKSLTKREIKTNLKRKTIGVIRSRRKQSGVKSKSFNVGRDRSDQDEDGTVTPTIVFKLVQEGVKNKHSTAKKPESKRSIIDNLNQSDFVKQLFNSPVKRKLSQSMTEFSRRQMFDDDQDVPRKLTRQTTALTGRTPENSILDQTQNVTADVFVSPLTTPSNSPNLEGVKRLFAKNTPENDLRDVRGVKGLLRTPRNRRSIKNDLTDVSGVKGIFAKSPRNSLSDVRVKKLFAASPKNDLRRVSKVKTVLKSTRKQKSPKNTLEDVGGIKMLFKGSPRNDIRNISGVKDALQIRSPRNDLTDVRGVKRMFRLEKQKYESDVSGVEELFHESNLDSTFDLLMGKPPLRTYPKAASVQKVKQKVNLRKAKSLHDSIDLITNNVEEWLEQHKPKQVYSEHTLPIKKRSLVNKSNNESKAKLPIKKRVLHSTPMKGQNATMNASELGRVSPIHGVTQTCSLIAHATAGTSQITESSTLLGRSVVTRPQRTKANTTNEISNSIAVKLISGNTQDTEAQAVSKITKAEPKSANIAKGKTTKSKIQACETDNVTAGTSQTIISSKLSPTETKLPPRRTRGRAKQSPIQSKVNKSIRNTIKRRKSLVITKKTPIARPSLVVQDSNDTQEPTKANARRKPKLEVTFAVPKASPVRRTRRKADVVVVESKPKRGRKNIAEKVEESVKVVKQTAKKTSNAQEVVTQDSKPAKRTRKVVEVETETKPKRGRKQAVETNKTIEKVKRGGKTVETVAIIEEKPKRRRKVADLSNEETVTKSSQNQKVEKMERIVEPKKSRRNNATTLPEVVEEKVQVVEAKRSRRNNAKTIPDVVTEKVQIVEPKRSRRNNNATILSEVVEEKVQVVEPKRSRRNNNATILSEVVEEKVQVVEPKRSRRNNNATILSEVVEEKVQVVEPKRSRRHNVTTLSEVVVEKVQEPKRSRRNNVTTLPEVDTVKDIKGKKLAKSQSAAVQPERARRNLQVKSEETIVDVKPVRGKKAQAQSIPPTGGRKRKIDSSPAKETGGRAKKLKAAPSSPVEPRTKRGTKNQATQVTQQNTRTRRR